MRKTKIANLIAMFIESIYFCSTLCEIHQQKASAFASLAKTEKRMSFKAVCELNCAIFESVEIAERRLQREENTYRILHG